VAAQQARFREAETGALSQLLGQQQLGAQQQLLGLTQTGLGAQGLLEQQEMDARGQVMGSINRFLGGRTEAEKLGPEIRDLWQKLFDSITGGLGTNQPVTTAPTELSATPSTLLRRQPGRFESGFTAGF
jgi:hypothetical protein